MAKVVGYVPDFALPELIARGVDASLTITVRGPLGAIVAASAATLTVRDSGGTIIVSDDAEVGDDAAGHTASFALSGLLTASLQYSARWTVEWNVTLVGGPALSFRNIAALCRSVPTCPVSEADVFQRVPALDPSRPGAICAETDWGGVIADAWVQVQALLLEHERRPELMVSSGQLREPVLLLALAGIYDSLAAGSNRDVGYLAIADGYRARFADRWSSATFAVDADEDGATDGGRERARGPTWLL